MIFTPSPFYLDSRQLWQAWIVLSSSLFLTFILAFYLLKKLRYTAEIERRVSQEIRTNQQLAREVSERKLAEEALHHSLEKYEKTFEAAPIWVVLSYLEDDRYMEVNEIFLKTMGYKKEEVIEKISLELNTWVDPRDRERIAAQVKEMGGVRIREVQRKTRSGAVIDTLLSAEILRLEDKPVMISVTQEITVQKKTEAEREKLQSQLLQAQKMESVGRLAGGVAHDFNNMLGVIQGRAELMFMGIKPADPHYEDLHEIYKAAQRSVDLTRQLLTFARKQTIAPKVLDLNDTVEGMFKMLRRLIGEDIDLVWKPGTQLWPVKVDPAQVDQILANLCVNARDAIDGTGKVTIETENVVLDQIYCSTHAGFEPGQYLMLAVSDDGRGIDKQTLENLFEPFFTTKEVGEGTGLGLATVYGIVKQNSGFINVYSEPGQGTTFKICLPQAQEAAEAKGKPIAKTIPKGSETVLMVEDEASILRLGKTVLEKFGYKVLAAHTPRQALVTAEQYEGPIHLLVTDVVMPEMNGKELVERIEKLRPYIKVLFMSGYTVNVIVHRGIIEDNVDFLPKPFTINSLGAKVREVLGRQE
jgi:PAS domain S-box-containing protein